MAGYGCSIILWNVGILPQNYTASQTRKTRIESSSPWKPQVSHSMKVCFQVRAKFPRERTELNSTDNLHPKCGHSEVADSHDLPIVHSFHAHLAKVNVNTCPTGSLFLVCKSLLFSSLLFNRWEVLYKNSAPFIHMLSKEWCDNVGARVTIFIHVLCSGRQLGASGLIIVILHRLSFRRRCIKSRGRFGARTADRQNCGTKLMDLFGCWGLHVKQGIQVHEK
jgi:hypothetical protein